MTTPATPKNMSAVLSILAYSPGECHGRKPTIAEEVDVPHEAAEPGPRETRQRPRDDGPSHRGGPRSGECWIGSTTWHGQRLMRISVSSWRTTEADVERRAIVAAAALATRSHKVSGLAASPVTPRSPVLANLQTPPGADDAVPARSTSVVARPTANAPHLMCCSRTPRTGEQEIRHNLRANAHQAPRRALVRTPSSACIWPSELQVPKRWEVTQVCPRRDRDPGRGGDDHADVDHCHWQDRPHGAEAPTLNSRADRGCRSNPAWCVA